MIHVENQCHKDQKHLTNTADDQTARKVQSQRLTRNMSIEVSVTAMLFPQSFSMRAVIGIQKPIRLPHLRLYLGQIIYISKSQVVLLDPISS